METVDALEVNCITAQPHPVHDHVTCQPNPCVECGNPAFYGVNVNTIISWYCLVCWLLRPQ